MRKFYSLLLLMAAGFYGFNAEAKTFTVSVDNPSAVVVRNPSDGYQPIDFGTGNSVELTVDDSAYSLPISCNNGFLVSSVTDAAGVSVADTYPVLPADNAQILVSKVSEGTTVSIATEVKPVKTFTFIGNPEHVRISMDYSDLTAVDGKWILTPGDYSKIDIYANSGYILRGVTDGAGNTTPAYGGSLSIYASSYTTSQTFTINSCPEAEVRTASFTVIVDGSYNDVSLQRNSDNATLSLTGNTTTVIFDPENETGYTLGHTVYNKALYSVMVDNVPVSAQGNRYSVTVRDGSVVKVTPDFPDKDVPVSFSYTNPGTEGVVSAVRVNGQNVSGWNESGFSVKLGSTLEIQANTSDFENVSATVNGQSIYAQYYSTTVTEETPLNFVYTATKAAPMFVTVEAVCPEGIRIEKGYTGETYTLTGELTVLEVSKSQPALIVKAVDGYRIVAIEDANGNTYSSNSSIYATDGMQLTIVAEEFVRGNNLTVYVGAGGWQYRSLTLSENNYDLRKPYSDSQLPIGYSVIPFADSDLPITLSGYPALYAYLNGERVEAPQYGNPSIGSASDGDVLKLFCSEPDTHTITYTIAVTCDVEVRHDRTQVIENPSTHNVVGTTEVHIVPVAPLTRAAKSTMIVKVNDEVLTPDSEGKYVATINGDAAINVDPDWVSGIETVEAEVSADTPVYNLQGIAVGKVAGAAALPSGVYIVGGKKVIL